MDDGAAPAGDVLAAPHPPPPPPPPPPPDAAFETQGAARTMTDLLTLPGREHGDGSGQAATGAAATAGDGGTETVVIPELPLPAPLRPPSPSEPPSQPAASAAAAAADAAEGAPPDTAAARFSDDLQARQLINSHIDQVLQDHVDRNLRDGHAFTVRSVQAHLTLDKVFGGDTALVAAAARLGDLKPETCTLKAIAISRSVTRLAGQGLLSLMGKDPDTWLNQSLQRQQAGTVAAPLPKQYLELNLGVADALLREAFGAGAEDGDGMDSLAGESDEEEDDDSWWAGDVEHANKMDVGTGAKGAAEADNSRADDVPSRGTSEARPHAGEDGVLKVTVSEEGTGEGHMGVDQLFGLYEDAVQSLVELQLQALEKGIKPPEKINMQVMRYIKRKGMSHANRMRLVRFLPCYALHCLDRERMEEVRAVCSERREGTRTWRALCSELLLQMAQKQNWHIQELFASSEKLRVWPVPRKLLLMCVLERARVLNVDPRIARRRVQGRIRQARYSQKKRAMLVQQGIGRENDSVKVVSQEQAASKLPGDVGTVNLGAPPYTDVVPYLDVSYAAPRSGTQVSSDLAAGILYNRSAASGGHDGEQAGESDAPLMEHASQQWGPLSGLTRSSSDPKVLKRRAQGRIRQARYAEKKRAAAAMASIAARTLGNNPTHNASLYSLRELRSLLPGGAAAVAAAAVGGVGQHPRARTGLELTSPSFAQAATTMAAAAVSQELEGVHYRHDALAMPATAPPQPPPDIKGGAYEGLMQAPQSGGGQESYVHTSPSPTPPTKLARYRPPHGHVEPIAVAAMAAAKALGGSAAEAAADHAVVGQELELGPELGAPLLVLAEEADEAERCRVHQAVRLQVDLDRLVLQLVRLLRQAQAQPHDVLAAGQVLHLVEERGREGEGALDTRRVCSVRNLHRQVGLPLPRSACAALHEASQHLAHRPVEHHEPQALNVGALRHLYARDHVNVLRTGERLNLVKILEATCNSYYSTKIYVTITKEEPAQYSMQHK
eukprot:SM000089S23859  [mRNA]  locus=s89:458085:464931:+ [translate_table: standard]